MAIYRNDGSKYELSGDFHQYDPEQPDFELFNLWDEEAIQRGGSPIYYYEMFLQPQTIDPIHGEDRGKIFSSQPIQLWASYDPKASQNIMDAFGIDAPDEVIFQLNYRATLREIGHAPKIGSRIYTPHLKENWNIVQRDLSEFKLWNAIRLELICQKFQESTTTGEGRVTQSEPDLKL